MSDKLGGPFIRVNGPNFLQGNKKKPIQCFKNRENQIPEAVGMKHIALETRKLATELTQRKNSIISKCL